MFTSKKQECCQNKNIASVFFSLKFLIKLAPIKIKTKLFFILINSLGFHLIDFIRLHLYFIPHQLILLQKSTKTLN